MKKVLPYIFFFAWLACGCSVKEMLDDWLAYVIAALALIIIVVIGVVLAEEMPEE